MPPAFKPNAVALGSLVVLAGLGVALWWRERPAETATAVPPLIVYAAPTSRLPLEETVAEYERETGRRVELRFGPSEEILTRVRLPRPTEPADLFIPADDSYIRQARELGLVAESLPIARVRAVILTARGNPKHIAAWSDLLKGGVRVAVPNPGAAVGKLARDHLVRTGRWAALQPHVVDTGSVTEAANAAKAGGVDAAIVWDVVATGAGYSGQTMLAVPELDGVTGRIEVAVLTQSRDPDAARRFAGYVTAKNRGLAIFRKHRFPVEESTTVWGEESGAVPGGAK